VQDNKWSDNSFIVIVSKVLVKELSETWFWWEQHVILFLAFKFLGCTFSMISGVGAGIWVTLVCTKAGVKNDSDHLWSKPTSNELKFWYGCCGCLRLHLLTAQYCKDLQLWKAFHVSSDIPPLLPEQCVSVTNRCLCSNDYDWVSDHLWNKRLVQTCETFRCYGRRTEITRVSFKTRVDVIGTDPKKTTRFFLKKAHLKNPI